MRLQWNMNIMNKRLFTIFVYYKDACSQLSIESNASMTIGSTKRNTLSIPDSGLADAQFSFVPQKDGHVDLVAKSGVFSKGTEIAKSPVSIGDVYTCGEVSVYICPKQADYERSVHLSENREFLIGRASCRERG